MDLTVTPREAKRFAIRAIMAGLVPFIRSSPGLGKSAIVAAIAKEYNLFLIDCRLSTRAPTDINGIPYVVNGQSTFIPFDTFPVVSTPIPEGYDGFLIFFDEFNSAQKSVLASAYNIILDKMVNGKPLHPNTAIIAAGNLDTDRAITTSIGTALQSRMVHLHMTLAPKDQFGQHSEFMVDVAYPQKWDERIISFLSYQPDRLYDFRADHNDKTFCCPRTWGFVNKLIQGQTYDFIEVEGHQVYTMDRERALYGGTITSGVALEFINYTKLYNEMPKFQDIIKDPANIPVPPDNSVKWSVNTMLMSNVTAETFVPTMDYVNRFSNEFRVMFMRGIIAQKPELKAHPAFRASLGSVVKFLHDDL